MNRIYNMIGVVILTSTILFPTITAHSNFPSIHVLDIFFPVLLFILFVHRSKLPQQIYFYTPLFFALYVLFSILIQEHSYSSSDFFEIYKWLKYAVTILFFFLLDFQVIKKTIPWLLISLVIINCFHFFNWFNINVLLEKYYNGGLHIHFFGRDSEGGPAVKRLVGTMGNPNINALLFGFFSIYYFPLKFEKSKISLFFLSLLFLFLCQSRTSLLVLASIFIFFAFFYSRIWTKKQWFSILGGLVLTFVLAWMFATSFFRYTSYNESLLNGGAFYSGSARGRFEVWKLLGDQILKNPIFGYGPFKSYFYNNRIYSENEYLLMTWRYGIFGIIFYLYIFFIPLVQFFKAHKTKLIQGIFILILMLVSALTNNPLTDRNIELLFCVAIAWTFQVYFAHLRLHEKG